jgi:deoxyribodipyrimidine photo-lyase
MPMKTIVWFRQDLRTRDNPALVAASARGKVIPVFVLDEGSTASRARLGGASRWWLHHSLDALRADLDHLTLFRGSPADLFPVLIKELQASAVYWNRCYEAAAINRDKELKTRLQKLGVEVQTFNASLLHEPWEVRTASRQPFKVYAPYWRASLTKPVASPLPAPKLAIDKSAPSGDRLEEWALRPGKPDWATGWEKLWTPGESGALARLDAFVNDDLEKYDQLRDRPDLQSTSRLSPHLHWGEVSPRQIWTRLGLEREMPSKREGVRKFLSELGWREFSYHLLYHFPKLAEENWRYEFNSFPWRESADDLNAWHRGQTGYPLVDAGMRELWRTGWMHNRVRMVVASFLVKHLRIDWREGEAWFWDTLLDADLANNAAGWQWVAGSGADASPYFRIFNPVSQGKKFDPHGDYVRRWVPELARLPNEHIHAPFTAAPAVLEGAGVRLGQDYPLPIVDLDHARKAALRVYEKIRGIKHSTRGHELEHARD